MSDDFVYYTGPWFDRIRTHGGFAALREGFYNYNPAYMYLLVVATYLFPGAALNPAPLTTYSADLFRDGFSAAFSGFVSSVDCNFAIKLVSIFFDFLNAFLIYRIVRTKRATGFAPFLAGLVALFLPTVVLNSSLWGQADAIYTSGLLGCVYFVLAGSGLGVAVAFGLALSIKLQAGFLGPLLAVLFIRGTLPRRYFLLVPVVYLLTLVPAAVVGRPVDELLMIYLQQVDTNKSLALHAPSLYQWLPGEHYELIYRLGLIVVASVAIVLIAVFSARRRPLTPDILVALATFCLLIVPFLTPRMHDRYFYPADVLTVAFAFFFPRFFVVPIAVGLASLLSYSPFLFNFEVLPLPWLAVVMLFAIVAVGLHLFSLLSDEESLLPKSLARVSVVSAYSFVLLAMILVPLALNVPAVAATHVPPALVTTSELGALPHRLDVAYGNSLVLVGYGPARPRVNADGQLSLDLYWRKYGRESEQHLVSVQLIDDRDRKIFQNDFRRPPSLWPVTGVVRERVTLDVPASDYPFVGNLVVAAYSPDKSVLDARDREGRVIGKSVVVGQYKSPPPDRTAEAVTASECVGAGVSLGGKIALRDCSLSGRRLHSGDTLSGQIVWSVIEPLDVDYTAFVQLVGPKGLAAQYDSRPRAGGYPTTWWEAGEVVSDDFALPLKDVAPGEYRLIAGYYDLRDGQRLVKSGVDYVDLGSIVVE